MSIVDKLKFGKTHEGFNKKKKTEGTRTIRRK